ncbi:phosphoglycerate kinase [Candidatus Woesearchaeota archaeon]|nr:phosphoglycerate kinase [Candidatus Woesearchaeota archaeon]MCF7900859.1 phosphoglycerate kinase [Candidatus Woesearchaeota archaeon]MCF8014025.1 phosphoglycerate kinase [Candidatus Woesearchaeota archaeon]
MPVNTIEGMEFKGKKVFLRAGFDVPINSEGKILDDFRIKETIPTIKTLFRKGAKQIIIGSHQGRPKTAEDQSPSKVAKKVLQHKEKHLQMDEIAKLIFKLTKKSTQKLDDCINFREEEFPSPEDARIVVLENLRFYKEEEENDEEFAEELAKYADIYVNDAFAVSHREHASMCAITNFIPGCVGLLVEKEIRAFNKILKNPERPYMAIIGGAKLKTKLPLIQNLIDKVDKLFLGGAMIFTFYKAKGINIGKSPLDKDSLAMAQMLGNNDKIMLPKDIVISDDPESTNSINVTIDKIPSYMYGLDVGEQSVIEFKKKIAKAKTIIWNGPLGYYENPFFAKATVNILKFLAQSPEIKTIIGGGDTASLVMKLGLKDKFFHVSTGGGASLKLLETNTLIAIKYLEENNK